LIAWTAIRALLGRVPMLAWALAAALAWGAFQRHQAATEHAGKLKAVQELADLRLAAAQTTVTTLTRAIAGQQEAIHAAEEQTAAADRARLAVTAALAGLPERYRAAQRRSAAAATAGASAPAEAGPDLCPQLLSRAFDAAGRIAAAADRARVAGQACEASYDSAVKAAAP
jgi:hypothetical protein